MADPTAPQANFTREPSHTLSIVKGFNADQQLNQQPGYPAHACQALDLTNAGASVEIAQIVDEAGRVQDVEINPGQTYPWVGKVAQLIKANTGPNISAKAMYWGPSSKINFSPVSIPAVKGWMRLSKGTIDTGAYSVIPDELNFNPANPATQTDPAKRPTAGTSGNGLPTMSLNGTDQWMSADVIQAVNVTSPGAGFGVWVKPATLGGSSENLLAQRVPSTSLQRLSFFKLGDDLLINIFVDNANTRRGTAPDILNLGWQFVTFEYGGDIGPTEAEKCLITHDTVVQALNFTDDAGSPGPMPATLVQPTGNFGLFVTVKSSDTQTWNGEIGPNLYFFNRQLTVAERLALFTFQAPTV